jgi:hypothetical protein
MFFISYVSLVLLSLFAQTFAKVYKHLLKQCLTESLHSFSKYTRISGNCFLYRILPEILSRSLYRYLSTSTIRSWWSQWSNSAGRWWPATWWVAIQKSMMTAFISYIFLFWFCQNWHNSYLQVLLGSLLHKLIDTCRHLKRHLLHSCFWEYLKNLPESVLVHHMNGLTYTNYVFCSSIHPLPGSKRKCTIGPGFKAE